MGVPFLLALIFAVSEVSENQAEMCQRLQKVWQCGHAYIEDPHRCRTACRQNKTSCEGYAFAWAYRDPITEKQRDDCINCKRAHREEAKHAANRSFLKWSQAYSVLQDVSAHDNEGRRRMGQPCFVKSGSASAEGANYNTRQLPPLSNIKPQNQREALFQPFAHIFMPSKRTVGSSPTKRTLAAPGAPPTALIAGELMRGREIDIPKDQKRRPCFANDADASRTKSQLHGWIPPAILPAPLKIETDTAPRLNL